MSEMIERVAKSIRALPWEAGEPLNIHDDAEQIARTAIEAMRSPAEAMVEAIHDVPTNANDAEVRLIWPAMIDTALNDHTQTKG